jgi:hypothetical protein
MLRFCPAVPGNDRPAEFSSKADRGHFLGVFKRELKGDLRAVPAEPGTAADGGRDAGSS